jgi:peptidyl-prolyl cis-trans isomerase C
LCISPALAKDDPILAEIGTEKFKMSDLERIINYYDEEKRKSLEQNPQYKVIILRRIVQTMVLSQNAREKGFDQRADIKEQLDLLSNDFIANQYIEKEVVGKIEVSDKDVELYYKLHKEEFGTPEMVRVRHILFSVPKTASDDEKKKTRAKAGEVLKQIREGASFEKLAAEMSDDTGSKYKGGDIGFFQKGRMVPEFENAAFSLKNGELSDVIETSFGYHILKLEEKKEPKIEPFEKVREKVRKKVFDELKTAKVEEFVNKSMEKAGVKMNPEPLMPKK